MKKQYINLHFLINEEDYDLAYSILENYNFTGIEEKYDELVLTMELDEYSDNLSNEILSEMNDLNINAELKNTEIIDDKNWNEEYEKKAKPIIVNERIGITPSWKSEEIDNEIKILINPKMSFGTGEHSTTRLVCQLMDGLVEKDSEWIDVGTGTGVLAILGIKLGAKSFLAFDNNEWSVDNAVENAKLNNTDDKIIIKESDIDSLDLPSSDGIVANLFLHLVLKSFDKFYKSLKYNNSTLIISGIMVYDKAIVIEEAELNGFELINTITENEWIAFHFKPKGKK